MVETVDNANLADKLHKACENAKRKVKLKVLVQVNTSGESSKGGCKPEECLSLVKHIVSSCQKLEFRGLMTIGKIIDLNNNNNNNNNDNKDSKLSEDFETLRKCRLLVSQELKVEATSLELSMGMSHDYPLAIEYGSTNVRLGSCIFGDRNYSQEEKKDEKSDETKETKQDKKIEHNEITEEKTSAKKEKEDEKAKT